MPLCGFYKKRLPGLTMSLMSATCSQKEVLCPCSFDTPHHVRFRRQGREASRVLGSSSLDVG
jgi:hypothetical protein